MIPVLVPDMPTADELLPWLRMIDAAKWYANGGPLVQRLERELGDMLGASARCVTSGTAALELALRALRLPAGSLVVVPSVTFVATAQAVERAGLGVIFADVSPMSWCLTPERVLEIGRDRSRVRAVVPVCAYGQALPPGPWADLATRLPVVIDAAGALYDQQVPEGVTVCYSMHATKALGCGEGGVIATREPGVLNAVEALREFGPGGGNAKLDEYRAAVALAGLHRKRDDWQDDLERAYAANMPRGIRAQVGQRQTRRTLFPVLLPAWASAADAAAKLARAGVGTRQWYAPFPAHLEHFQPCVPPGARTPVADMLRDRGLGLPWHAQMRPADAAFVCDALRGVMAAAVPA